jgi:hypothetical protein
LARVVNIVANTRTDHKNWINAHLREVRDPEALAIVSSLTSAGKDVGEHIYSSGRCAVAHAHGDPVINPDSADDLERMTQEMPLIRTLAEIVIEKVFGIRSQATIWEQHLYELAGFKTLIPKSILDEVMGGASRELSEGEIDFGLTLGLRHKSTYGGLANLAIVRAGMDGGRLELLLATPGSSVSLWAGLDFKAERLLIDPYRGHSLRDDGSKRAAVEIKSFFEFRRDLFLNGEVEFKDAKTQIVLGHSHAFIPTNIDLTRTIESFDRQIAALGRAISTRQ